MSNVLKIATAAIAFATIATAGARVQAQTMFARTAALPLSTARADAANDAAFTKEARDPRFTAALLKGDAVAAKALLVRAGALRSIVLVVPKGFNVSDGPQDYLDAPHGCDHFHAVHWYHPWEHWITVCDYADSRGQYAEYGAL